MKFTLLVSLVVLVSLGLVQTSQGHNYAVDSYGCHNNTALNVYECHKGQFTGRSWPNPGGKTAMLAELAAIPPVSPPVVLTGEGVLTWTPNTEPDLAGYLLYWAIEPGKWQKPIKLGKISTLTLPNLLRGATYYFALTAVNTAGLESGKSNIVSKTLE